MNDGCQMTKDEGSRVQGSGFRKSRCRIFRLNPEPRTLNPLRRRPRRGIALVLVLVAVSIAVVMSAAFLTEQAMATQLALNVVNAAHARTIAESGLQMTVVYIQNTSTWRAAKSPGTWVANQAFGGGTFSVNAQDGWDSNGDGVVEGNANFSDATHSVTITVTGTYKGAKYAACAVLAPQAGGTASQGVFANGSLTLSNNGLVDSYDSGVGAYGGGNRGQNAHVATNLTSNGAISVGNGADLYGNVSVAPGGNLSQTVSLSNNATYTGTTQALSAAVPLPTITAPDLGAAQPAFNLSNGANGTISGSVHLADLNLSNNAHLTISGNVTIVCDGQVSIGNGSVLEILAGASLKLYCKAGATLSNNATAQVNGANLSRLTLYNIGNSGVNVGNGAVFSGVIIAPNAAVTMSNNATVFGLCLAGSISVGNGAGLHEDVRITGGADPVTVPGWTGSTTPGGYGVRWLAPF